MTACFEKSGIRFLYPENWRITDEQLSDDPLSVSVQSPESGFWSLMAYEADMEPSELTEHVLESMRLEYEGLEESGVVEPFDDVQWTGYDMCFYCLDFVVHSRTLAVRTHGKTLLMMWQAEDREFDQLEPVFRAITTSLLQSDHAIG